MQKHPENKDANEEQISSAPFTNPSKRSIAMSTAKSKQNNFISSIKRQLSGNHGTNFADGKLCYEFFRK